MREEGFEYGRRDIKVYPINEYELENLWHAVIFSCFLVGIPFLMLEVFRFVRRLKRETNFDVR